MAKDHSLEYTIALSRWLRKHDVSMPQFAALLCVLAKSPLTMSEISRAAQVTTAASTAIVDKLEHLKWVKRSEKPGDRRTTHVTILEAGRLALDEILKPAHDLETMHETFSK
jgi:DNA-binding MarR family transcriptional regulator